jgi:hypothetical protein
LETVCCGLVEEHRRSAGMRRQLPTSRRGTTADYLSPLLHRAYARQGTAYAKTGDLDSAILSFNKSLTEHRTPDVLAKLKEVRSTFLFALEL